VAADIDGSFSRTPRRGVGFYLGDGVALLDEVTDRDREGDDGAGDLGQHRNLHLHGLEQHDRILDAHLVADGDQHLADVADDLGDNGAARTDLARP
jgi:hypothetical protein